MSHMTKPVLHPGSDTIILVDEVIIPLITTLWELGIDTTQSCQEWKPGCAWVVFGDESDAFRLLSILLGDDEEAINYEDPFVAAIASWDVAGPQNGFWEPGTWDWAVLPYLTDVGWSMITSVSIPTDALDELVKRLQSALA